MRHSVALLCILITAASLSAQPGQAPQRDRRPSQKPAAETSRPEQALPVHQVVLYKNGIGYFEHLGQVNGDQHVAIDFTSSQLNDVLQSLTILDENGGRIGGVNYNSTTPLAEQLKSLSLAMDDDPSSTELFQALRGQRVEVTGAPGGAISGRLLSIEQKPQRLGASPGTDNTSTTIERSFLTIVAASGAVRVIELTPALSVRPLDPNLQGQLDRYLELLSSTHTTGLRHLSLDALGAGQRQLRVSYISEIPVWKSTYRIVFPKDSAPDSQPAASASAIFQGWAVVDNTIGSDWDNVQLSLVAGAPQSFIQPLSQPLYLRRPEVAISTTAQTTPQTHEAAEEENELQSPTKMPKSIHMAAAATTGQSRNGPLAEAMRNRGVAGMASQSVTVSADEAASGSAGGVIGGLGSGNGYGMGIGSGIAGGIYDATNAINQGDVATKTFDDFFQYQLAQPVTIHKNESAMVPILQEKLPAERVTLWSQSETTPFRAIWLENTSKLTFDRGSFSIFESGVFAGQGLLDPIHPGEKRLLSYAADQAIHVRETNEENKREIREIHITAQQGNPGLIQKRYAVEGRSAFTVSNSADQPRVVVLELPRRPGRTLTPETKPAETAPSLYRFRLPVAARQSASQLLADEGYDFESWLISPEQDQVQPLENLIAEVPAIAAQINPILTAQREIARMQLQLQQYAGKITTLTADEARARENLTALKGNDVAKRFVDELNHAEDELQTVRKQNDDLIEKRKAAIEALRQTLLTFEVNWQSPNWTAPPK